MGPCFLKSHWSAGNLHWPLASGPVLMESLNIDQPKFGFRFLVFFPRYLLIAGLLESANSSILAAHSLFKEVVGENQDFMLIRFFKENDLIGCGGDPQPIRLQGCTHGCAYGGT